MSRNKTFRLLALARPGRLLLALALSALLFSGCAPARYVSKIRAAEAQPIALLEPMSEVSYIEKDGTYVLDQGLSETSTQILTDILTSLPLPVGSGLGTPVQRVIPMDYSGENNIYSWHLSALAGVRPKKLKNAGVPDEITNLLRANGYRYGMLVYHAGFRRDRSNYAKGVAKDVAVGVATAVVAALLGGGAFYTGYQLRYASRLYLMIVDVEENEIVYFANTANMEEETDPLNLTEQRYRLARMLERFK